MLSDPCALRRSNLDFDRIFTEFHIGARMNRTVVLQLWALGAVRRNVIINTMIVCSERNASDCSTLPYPGSTEFGGGTSDEPELFTARPSSGIYGRTVVAIATAPVFQVPKVFRYGVHSLSHLLCIGIYDGIILQLDLTSVRTYNLPGCVQRVLVHSEDSFQNVGSVENRRGFTVGTASVPTPLTDLIPASWVWSFE